MAFDSPSTNLSSPAAAEIVTTNSSVRRHNTSAAILCIVIVIGIAITARWIQEREAVVHESFAASRTATIERILLATDLQLMQLFADADSAMLPALAELDGRDPCTVPAEAHATFAQFAASAMASRLALDIWCRDGSNMLRPERPGAGRDIHFAIHSVPDAGTRASVIDSFRGMYVSTPAFDPATLDHRVRLTRPVLGADGTLQGVVGVGTLQGVVGVGIRLSALTDLLKSLRERASERIALYRNDRMLVAQYPAESAVGIVDTPYDALWRHYPSSAFGHFETQGRAGGDDTLSVYFGLRPLPLVVAYTTEWRPISREALGIYWPILVIAAAALIAAFVYAWISIRYANALSRANAELAHAKEHLQFEADERGIFIANMNHELRTPLNAIVGFAQILADATFGPSHPKYREYARDIASSGQHLQTLIGEIIDFAAIDRGHRNIAITRLDAADAVAETARLMRPIADARGITIDTVGEDVWALGDLAAVRQILINLMTNAIKFSMPGGTVTIECRAEAATGFVEICVTDRGAGIAPAELPSIGRPFFRTRAARLGAVSGAGLGLSISVALANQMGGRLTLKSEQGQGTTVTLVLPQAETVRMQAYATLR